MTKNVFPASYTRGAMLLRQLQTMQPGQVFRIHVERLLDIEVPANSLDRQTPEYLANWMHSRMPFRCTLRSDPLGRWFEIERPTLAS